MKRRLTLLLLSLITSLAAAASGLLADGAWVREAPPGASMMAAYLVITNPTNRDARLVGVESPVFAHVMMHKSVTVDGMARMLHQDSILIPAHGSVALEPGGYHLMMPAPDTRLSAGDEVEFLLHFDDNSSVRVTAVVRKKP
ncbi:MAG: copper chaperone PCu(A)C [Thiogranum sp.]